MKLSGLVGACHPLPSIAVTAVSGAFALAAGRGSGGTVVVMLTILASQLSIGWHNDLVDAERDRIAGRMEKPIVAGRISAGAVRLAAALAAAAFIGLAASHGTAAGLIAVVAWASAVAYNIRLKRAALSFLPYAVSFGLLPAFVTVGGDEHDWPPLWVIAAAALLGIAAHFANVLPDLESDRRTGVWGLPQRLGHGPSTVAAALALAAASTVLVLARPETRVSAATAGLVAALSGVVLVLVFGRSTDRTRSRVAFLAVVGVAAIDAVLLVAAGGAV